MSQTPAFLMHAFCMTGQSEERQLCESVCSLIITKIFETNQDISLKSSGNNGFDAEDMNDNITGIGNSKQHMKSGAPERVSIFFTETSGYVLEIISSSYRP